MQVDLLPGPKDVILKIIEESENNEIIFHTVITLKELSCLL